MAAERRRAAVLGHPIAHSLSPVLHRAAYAELGLEWSYDAVDVTQAELPGFLGGLGAEWGGLSLTMPLKTVVLPLLDHVDEVARVTGAANTVVLEEGRRRGYNTDVEGIVAALRDKGAQTVGGRAGILGGGATARSACAALAELGATSILLAARRPDACGDVRVTAARLGVTLEVVSWDRAVEVANSPVGVSAVPRGVADALAEDFPTSSGTLLDVVYEPWPTPLASAWSAGGGAIASGLDMLLHQAVVQVRLMTGQEPSIGPMRSALLAAVAAR